ncbi:methyltransferase domain-containing protein [archaeon]|nr:methyltransferase domain-containing protein [archaeon]
MKRTICETLREIKAKFPESALLADEAIGYAQKMDKKLREYKRDYESGVFTLPSKEANLPATTFWQALFSKEEDNHSMINPVICKSAETNLNLGCGLKKLEGFINIDSDKKVKPDMILDLNCPPYPFKDSSIDSILADNLVEHLGLPMTAFFNEIHRILKPNGRMHFIMPNFFSLNNRIEFCLGRFKARNGWHINHSIIISGHDLKAVLEHQGFSIETKINPLFDREINWVIRKRA